MKRKFFLFMTVMFAVVTVHGQTTLIKGVVTDSLSGETLPYASVMLKGTDSGTVTDENGEFSFSTSKRVQTVEVSYLGYDAKDVKIVSGKVNNLDIRLVPSGIALDEVVIRPQHERYRRRDNPAVDFVRKVIDSRNNNDPRNHDYYCYDRYERILVAVNDFSQKKKKSGKYDFVSEFVDTLEIGTSVLPISEKEKLESVFYRNSPKSEKHVVKGSKSAGVDEIFTRDGVQQFLDEAFKEVNIFQNNISLFLQRFVSPLSTIGPAFYKYYLLDTLEVNNQSCVDLGFVPFNSELFGFTGHLYVTLDSTYFVKKVVLNVPKDINLNFVHGMTIEQMFERLPDDTRIIMKDDIRLYFKLSEKSKGLYAQRLNIYSNQSFDEPDELQAKVFKESAPVITLDGAYNRSEDFWNENRPNEEKDRNPNSVDKLMARLRSVPAFYFTEKVVTILVSGYIPTNKDPLKNKFDLGPMNSTINGNAIEGARFRVGGGTTPVFNKHWFLEGYAAYGTRDEKLKYDALVEYSFNPRKDFRLEYPMHSLRLEYSYDINKLGQNYMYTSRDNVMLSIKRKKDNRATYLRKAELTYTREHYNGISYGAVIRGFREYATPYSEFNRIGSDGISTTPLSHYNMTELELKFRYGKNEKFYQTRTKRVPLTFDAFIFNLSHIMAKKGLLGSSYNYQRTEVGMQKRFWFSAFGYADLIVKGGKVWNKVPYPLLILPNANLTYTIQPESYTNMNALEFINDEYLSWDLTYYMNGNLFNRLPLIKKLKWREVFCFRGLWGHLTDKNNPFKNGEGLYEFPEGSYVMGKTPYMEASVGIENIFKFLRIDYVWRMSYRDNPDIQKRGIRCTMRLSF